jgi:predicted dehydrogenase
VEQVRLGVVGVGWFGTELTRAARKTGLADVISCFARSGEHRRAFAEEHGCRAVDSLDAMLEDPAIEGILVATPHSTHGPIIDRAASAGKHVFVEKPMTLTVRSALHAIEVTEAAGVTLQVGQNMRRQPANRRIKAMLDAGELGTLLAMQGFYGSAFGLSPELPAWRQDPAESPAGGMTAFGAHTVDTFHYFAGPARRVSAFSKQVAGLLPVDDATAVMIEYDSGPIGVFGTSYFVPYTNVLAVYGTSASAWIEEDGAGLSLQGRDDEVRGRQELEPLDTVEDEMAEFARCVRQGGRPETGGREGLEVAAVLEAVVESAASGRAVELTERRAQWG